MIYIYAWFEYSSKLCMQVPLIAWILVGSSWQIPSFLGFKSCQLLTLPKWTVEGASWLQAPQVMCLSSHSEKGRFGRPDPRENNSRTRIPGISKAGTICEQKQNIQITPDSLHSQSCIGEKVYFAHSTQAKFYILLWSLTITFNLGYIFDCIVLFLWAKKN